MEWYEPHRGRQAIKKFLKTHQKTRHERPRKRRVVAAGAWMENRADNVPLATVRLRHLLAFEHVIVPHRVIGLNFDSELVIRVDDGLVQRHFKGVHVRVVVGADPMPAQVIRGMLGGVIGLLHGFLAGLIQKNQPQNTSHQRCTGDLSTKP